MSYRIEKDTMGQVKVPADKYWGAQTQRSRKILKLVRRQVCQKKSSMLSDI
jgi:fumarate hydratase class II